MILYQIQNKYRDEARPRAGILRGREFLMKDSYSFDTDGRGPGRVVRPAPRGVPADLRASRPGLPHLRRHRRRHGRLQVRGVPRPGRGRRGHLRRLPELRLRGQHRGDHVRAEAGGRGRPCPPLEEIPTPDTPTIETLAAYLGVPASATLKNLLVKVDGEIVAVGVPGDREVDMDKVEAHFAPAAVELVTAEDFVGRADLVRGYVGPQGLEKVRYIADPRVAPGTAWITGANKEGKHAKNVVAGRDFEVDEYVDVVVVQEGDPCPELRHRPQAGPRHRDRPHLPAGPQVRRRPPARRARPEGKPVRVTMGSYGIGVSRAVAALAEQTPTTRACVWPARDRPGRRPRRRRGQGAADRAGPRRLREAERGGRARPGATTGRASRRA